MTSRHEPGLSACSGSTDHPGHWCRHVAADEPQQAFLQERIERKAGPGCLDVLPKGQSDVGVRKELVRLGRKALIAAGMPKAQARKQTGGLYNVNGFQIIFATNEGGNHYDHLHVGYREGR